MTDENSLRLEEFPFLCSVEGAVGQIMLLFQHTLLILMMLMVSQISAFRVLFAVTSVSQYFSLVDVWNPNVLSTSPYMSHDLKFVIYVCWQCCLHLIYSAIKISAKVFSLFFVLLNQPNWFNLGLFFLFFLIF